MDDGITIAEGAFRARRVNDWRGSALIHPLQAVLDQVREKPLESVDAALAPGGPEACQALVQDTRLPLSHSAGR